MSFARVKVVDHCFAVSTTAWILSLSRTFFNLSYAKLRLYLYLWSKGSILWGYFHKIDIRVYLDMHSYMLLGSLHQHCVPCADSSIASKNFDGNLQTLSANVVFLTFFYYCSVVCMRQIVINNFLDSCRMFIGLSRLFDIRFVIVFVSSLYKWIGGSTCKCLLYLHFKT